MEPYTFIRTNKKIWGEEHVVADEPAYCGKLMRLAPGFQCSMHLHRNKDETFHVIAGMMDIEIGGNLWTMKKGQSLRVPPGAYHRFSNPYGRDCVFFECSTHDSPEDNHRMTQSGPIKP